MQPYFNSYSVSNAALSQFTRCLAAAVQEFGISVFAYAPGFVRTGVTEHIANSANVPKEVNERFQQRFETGDGLDSMEDVTKKLMFLVTSSIRSRICSGDGLSGCCRCDNCPY